MTARASDTKEKKIQTLKKLFYKKKLSPKCKDANSPFFSLWVLIFRTCHALRALGCQIFQSGIIFFPFFASFRSLTRFKNASQEKMGQRIWENAILNGLDKSCETWYTLFLHRRKRLGAMRLTPNLPFTRALKKWLDTGWFLHQINYPTTNNHYKSYNACKLF